MTQDSNGAAASADAARFDWYAATVNTVPDALVAQLANRFDAEPERGRGMHSYSSSVQMRSHGEVVAQVLHGGPNGLPHVWASGDRAPQLAEMLRRTFPEHRVSRADSALDFKGQGAWERLLSVAVAIATPDGGRHLRLNQQGDWMREGAPAGRTLYIGSKTSPAMVRLYEKGKQMRGLVAPSRAAEYDETWVRLELQLRPLKASKERAAAASPLELWGYSRWTQSLLEAATQLEVDRVPMWEQRDPDDERALRYLVRQYGPLLERVKRAHDGRSWEQIGVMLGKKIERARLEKEGRWDVH